MKKWIGVLVCLLVVCAFGFAQTTTYITAFNANEDFGDTGTTLAVDGNDVYCVTGSVVRTPEIRFLSNVFRVDPMGGIIYNIPLVEDSLLFSASYENSILFKDDSLIISSDALRYTGNADLSLLTMSKEDGKFRSLLRPVDTVPDGSESIRYSIDSSFFYESSVNYIREEDKFSWQLRKLNLQGGIEWSRRYLQSVNNPTLRDFRVLENNNIIMSYMAGIGGGYEQPSIMKLNADGDVLWVKDYTPSYQRIQRVTPSMTALQNGDIALGWTRDTFHPQGAVQESPPAVFILDKNGVPKDSIVFDGNIRHLYELQTMANGDIVGFGDARTDIGETGWMFRISPQAELIWERYIQDNRLSDDVATLLFNGAETADGGIAACGNLFSFIPPIGGGNLLRSWVVKLDADGCLEPGCTSDTIHLKRPVSIAPEIQRAEQPAIISPNPTAKDFRIEWGDKAPAAGKLDYAISRMDGAVVTTGQMSNGNERIDVSHLPGGVYFVFVMQHNRSVGVFRLVRR